MGVTRDAVVSAGRLSIAVELDINMVQILEIVKSNDVQKRRIDVVWDRRISDCELLTNG